MIDPDVTEEPSALALADDVGSRRGRAWLIEGAVGMGASTYAAAVTARLRPRDFDVVETPALPELQSVPLGALLPHVVRTVPDALDETPDRRLHRLLAHFAGVRKNTLLVIDSAAWLDELSASAVHQLVRAYGVRCVLTARLGHALPGPIQRLEDEGLLDRVRVPPVSEDEAVRLIERTAGGAVAPPSLLALLERAGTHPLFLRLLVEGSLRSGAARESPLGIDVGTPPAPARLRSLVEEWLALVAPAHHRTLGLLAVAVELPRAGLDEEDIAALVSVGLASGQPDTVRIASPVVGDVIRAGLDPATREDVLITAAALLSGDLPGTRLQRAALLSDTATPPPTAEVAWASRTATARGRHALAVRLGSRALELAARRGEPAPSDALVLRGESLSLTGRHDEAGEAYAAAIAASVDDASLALAASRAGSYWGLGRQDPARAEQITQDALAVIRDPEARGYLLTSMPKWQIMLGVAPPTSAASGRLGSAAADAAVAALDPNLLTALASCLSGDSVRVRRAIEAGRPHADAATPTIRHASELFDIATAMIDLFDGAVESARAACAAGASRRLSEAVGTWSFGLAMSEYLAGATDAALGHARQAVAQLGWRDLLAFRGFAIGLHATIAAWLGRRDEAVGVLGTANPAMRAVVLTDLQIAQAESWLAFRAGEPLPAAAVERAVADAEGRHHDWWLATAAHTAIRMGYPAQVMEVLRRLDPAPSAAAYAAIVAHGEALEREDAAALVRAALSLESRGMLAAAYDAARQALALAPGTETPDVRRQARVLVSRVGSLLSPAPAARSGIAELLTPREWAVASAAALRERNREIAERMGVSYRTVENHLAAAYRKLGVSGRDELRAVLRPDLPL